MPCDHLGPHEIIEMAERHLRDLGVPENRWEGTRFRHGENPEGAMWASVVIEIERRNGQWLVTRLDRNAEKIPAAETGLRPL